MSRRTTYLTTKPASFMVEINEDGYLTNAKSENDYSLTKAEAVAKAQKALSEYPGIYMVVIVALSKKGMMVYEEIMYKGDYTELHLLSAENPPQKVEDKENPVEHDWRDINHGLGAIYKRLDAGLPVTAEQAKYLFGCLSHGWDMGYKGAQQCGYRWDFTKALKSFALRYAPREHRSILSEAWALSGGSIREYYADDKALLGIYELREDDSF